MSGGGKRVGDWREESDLPHLFLAEKRSCLGLFSHQVAGSIHKEDADGAAVRLNLHMDG